MTNEKQANIQTFLIWKYRHVFVEHFWMQTSFVGAAEVNVVAPRVDAPKSAVWRVRVPNKNVVVRQFMTNGRFPFLLRKKTGMGDEIKGKAEFTSLH